MEEPLKHLMQELGNAINDSLSESDRIAEAIGEIKRAGYDVFLVLEATIGFNRRDEDAGEEEEEIEGAEPAALAGFSIGRFQPAYERTGFTVAESVINEFGDGFVMDDYRMTVSCARK